MSESGTREFDLNEFSPRIREEVRVLSQHWMQLALMCGIRENDEHLAGFFLLMQGISDFYDDGRQVSYRTGMDSGTAITRRCMADDWNKGAIAGMKWICATYGIDVPRFVHDMSAEVEYRDMQLRSETEAGKLLTQPLSTTSPVH